MCALTPPRENILIFAQSTSIVLPVPDGFYPLTSVAGDTSHNNKHHNNSQYFSPFPSLPSPQSSIFFVVASVELRGEDTPLGKAMSGAAWAAGSVYAVRFTLDLWLRAPLHWGPLHIVVEEFLSHWRGGMSRLRQAFATSSSSSSSTRPTEERPSMPTTPQATPAPRQQHGLQGQQSHFCIPSPQAI